MKGNNWLYRPRQTAIDHATVMIKFCLRYPPFFRLNPSPLDAESIGVQAQVPNQIQILGPPVIAVASISAGLREHSLAFKLPQVTCDIVPLDLVGRCGCPPKKSWQDTELKVVRMRAHGTIISKGLFGRHLLVLPELRVPLVDGLTCFVRWMGCPDPRRRRCRKEFSV